MPSGTSLAHLAIGKQEAPKSGKYLWVDENGNVFFSDKGDPSKYHSQWEFWAQ